MLHRMVVSANQKHKRAQERLGKEPEPLLSPEENAHVQNTMRLLGERGGLSEALRAEVFWKDVVDTSLTYRQRGKMRALDFYEENPWTVNIAGAVALGLGAWRIIQKMRGEQESQKSERKPMSRPAKVLSAGVVGSIALGLLFPERAKSLLRGPASRAMARRNAKNQPTNPELDVSKVEVATEKLENPDGSKTVCIGESIMHGISMMKAWSKKPDLVGWSNIKTGEVLRRVQSLEGRKKIRGKKEALIYMGGNNKGPEVVEDMIKVAHVCHKEGVKDIFLALRLPIDPRYKKKIISEKGQEEYNKRLAVSKKLRDDIRKAYQAGRFPPNTHIADLYGFMGQGTDELRSDLVQGPETRLNFVHPRAAYPTMVNFMRKAKNNSSADARVA